jgi:cell division protein FtsB
MQRVLIYIFSLAFVGYLGYQAFILQSERMELKGEYVEIDQQLRDLEEDNIELKSEIEYLSDPYNLEKELRSRLNYKLPYESLIIVVPKKEDTTSTDAN